MVKLCLNRVKPEETLVEARSDSDVQSIVEFGYRGERLIEPFVLLLRWLQRRPKGVGLRERQACDTKWFD